MEIWSVKLGGSGPELGNTLLGQRIIKIWIQENVNEEKDIEKNPDDTEPYDPDTIIEGSLWDAETESNYVVKKVVNL